MSGQIYHNLSRLGRASSGLARLHNSSLSRNSVCKSQLPGTQQCLFLSTSKKNRETIASDLTATPKATVPVEVEEPVKKKKYWVSQGYSHESEDDDINVRNRVMFSTVTLGFVLLGFLMMYMPDYKFRDWSQREAFLELARREALGLPLIDPNIIPPERMVLPTEEELGDFEIII